ncbi:hypothetical protein HYW11_04010 [Candidatus Peregrinibacteria bacterium]|nr:hypothetical protein [Candidatus Peregrinibacteria bacterium]
MGSIARGGWPATPRRIVARPRTALPARDADRVILFTALTVRRSRRGIARHVRLLTEKIPRAAAFLIADAPASKLPAGNTPRNAIRRPRHAAHTRLALIVLIACSPVIQKRHAYPYTDRVNTPGNTDVVAKSGTAIAIGGTRRSELETTETLLWSAARPGGSGIKRGLACKTLCSTTRPRLTGLTKARAWLAPYAHAHGGTTIEIRPAHPSIRPTANPIHVSTATHQSIRTFQLMLWIILGQIECNACFANISQRRIARLRNRKRKRIDHIDIILCQRNGKRGKKGNCKRRKNPAHHARMVPAGRRKVQCASRQLHCLKAKSEV